MNKKNTTRHKIWVIKKNTQNLFKNIFLKIKRTIRVLKRKIIPYKKIKDSYTLAILCIKKEAYTDLIIRQANSLHYFNPTHKFVIYADSVCSNVLEKKLSYFDYPSQIEIKNAFGITTYPWTYYKMEMRIENSRLGGIDIDADMYWHSDIIIDRTKPIMFAPTFLFKENEIQSKVITNLFNKPEWLDFMHFVSAFVSIPPEFMTDKLAKDARNYVKTILEDPLLFIPSNSDRDELRRVSKEIAICLALQSNYPNLTKPLKQDGGRKDRNMIEPIYYGVENRIIS